MKKAETMNREEIAAKLEEYRIAPSLINWKGNPIPATKIWYSTDDNRIYADCGVSISFVYDLKNQLYRCVQDISREIIKHYEGKGVHLEM